MRKTLLLTHEYYPFKGGVANYCYNLFRFLHKKDYMVVTDNPAVKTQENVYNIRLTNKLIRPSWITGYFKIKKIIKRQNIKVIFTPNILPLGTMAYFLKIPYVISLHGLDINLALKNRPRLTQKILNKAERVIVNSRYTYEIVKKLRIDNKKIHLLYPTTKIDTYIIPEKTQQLKRELSLGEANKILLTVSRLTRRKAQDLVIQAVAKLKNPHLKYFIIGHGPMEKNLRKMIKDYNLEKQIFVLTDVADNNLPYYYDLADIFVLAHRHDKTDIEGFGIVFLEAAMFGLPIIAGSSGGVTDIFTDQKNALLVKNDDLDTLTKHLNTLLNNPELSAKLGSQAKQRSGDFPVAKEQSLALKELLS
jgi:phosphatidyl-myo-inositol dimannoside synthase